MKFSYVIILKKIYVNHTVLVGVVEYKVKWYVKYLVSQRRSECLPVFPRDSR